MCIPYLRSQGAEGVARGQNRLCQANGKVITVYKREALVAASKGSFRSGSLKAIQSKEDWVLWASKALGTKRSLKRRADSIAQAYASQKLRAINVAIMCIDEFRDVYNGVQQHLTTTDAWIDYAPR
jgi:hypothetical protein